MSKEIVFAFTGDVMLGRTMNDIMEIYGLNYVFGDLKEELNKADLTFINLECAITDYDKKWDSWYKPFHFKMLPRFKEVLKIGGIDYANLANNHILDFKTHGLMDTLKFLDELNIKHTGAGKDIYEATKPVFFNVKGVRVCIFSFQDNHLDWIAGRNTPGTFYLEINKTGLNKIKKIIKKLRKSSDIVIVSSHWGPNMLDEPLESHINFAHTLIEYGVDIFHGHSSHVFQGVEKYDRGIILYDCGEFIDDYSIDLILRNDFSFLFKIKLLNKKIIEVELLPIVIKNFQVNMAQKENAEKINKMMIKRSSKFNTKFMKRGEKLFLRF